MGEGIIEAAPSFSARAEKVEGNFLSPLLLMSWQQIVQSRLWFELKGGREGRAEVH